ncbi:hypothetical protein ACQ4PT_065670 [Festuca glaucescens]
MGVGEEVKVVESCVVTPCGETPRKSLPLSPLDLVMANRGHTPLVFFYRSCAAAEDDIFFDVARLKAAMARALVSFYPLACRLGVDGDGRVQVDCAEQGLPFFVAQSDLTLHDFINFKPSPELRRLFVPRLDDSPSVVCAIQVTFLKCGGVALGVAVHHAVVDGISTGHFLRTWSAFSSGDGAAAAALEPPCHDRTLLRARSPPRVHPDALSVFCPKLSPSQSGMSDAVVNEIFTISKDQVAALKRICSFGGGSVSTFCAMGALVWRCVCAARRLQPDAMTRLTFQANVRRSLRPPLPDSYFGNGIIMLCATGKVRDIASAEQLASVAGRIGGAIRRMNDELVRSAIDYMERDMTTGRLATPAGGMSDTELLVVSWLGMPFYDVDFGWGKPLVMHRAVQQRAGLVYLMDGAGCSVRLLVSMEPAILNDFRRLLYGNTAKL